MNDPTLDSLARIGALTVTVLIVPPRSGGIWDWCLIDQTGKLVTMGGTHGGRKAAEKTGREQVARRFGLEVQVIFKDADDLPPPLHRRKR